MMAKILLLQLKRINRNLPKNKLVGGDDAKTESNRNRLPKKLKQVNLDDAAVGLEKSLILSRSNTRN